MIADETRCESQLVEMMKASPDKPVAKRRVWKERFSKLPCKAFERAWGNAVKKAAAPKWSAPGPRKKNSGSALIIATP
jgi:hypothetical protein